MRLDRLRCELHEAELPRAFTMNLEASPVQGRYPWQGFEVDLNAPKTQAPPIEPMFDSAGDGYQMCQVRRRMMSD